PWCGRASGTGSRPTTRTSSRSSGAWPTSRGPPGYRRNAVNRLLPSLALLAIALVAATPVPAPAATRPRPAPRRHVQLRHGTLVLRPSRLQPGRLALHQRVSDGDADHARRGADRGGQRPAGIARGRARRRAPARLRRPRLRADRRVRERGAWLGHATAADPDP